MCLVPQPTNIHNLCNKIENSYTRHSFGVYIIYTECEDVCHIYGPKKCVIHNSSDASGTKGKNIYTYECVLARKMFRK